MFIPDSQHWKILVIEDLKSLLILTIKLESSVAHPWQFGTDPGPGLWLMDPDPDTYVIDLHEANKKLFFYVFLRITFWRYIYIIFFKHKKS